MRLTRTTWGRRELLGACGAGTAFALAGAGRAEPQGSRGGIATGQAWFSADIRLPSLRYAVIARPPTAACTLAAFDAADALVVPGVEAVVRLQTETALRFPLLGGVAVVAWNTWAALRGRDALRVTWERGTTAPARSADDGEFYVPDLFTAPMEAPSATACIAAGVCEVWSAVRSPGLVRADVAAALGLRPQDVTVTVTVLGGGFGRVSRPTYATEAAMLSRHLGGAPVKLLWTRDDDLPLRHGAPRDRDGPTLAGDGKPVAWLSSR